MFVTPPHHPVPLPASCLVERSPAVLGSAQTRDLLVLDGKLVVVCNLFVDVDRLARVDYNLLLRLHCNHLGIAVRLRDTQVQALLISADWTDLLHHSDHTKLKQFGDNSILTIVMRSIRTDSTHN